MVKAMKTYSGKNREPTRINVDTSCKDNLTKWGEIEIISGLEDINL
jgi:hypothetical protein